MSSQIKAKSVRLAAILFSLAAAGTYAGVGECPDADLDYFEACECPPDNGRGGPGGGCVCSDFLGVTCDCDDSNPNINPAATESCNGVDDNCDGSTDEGLLCNDDCDTATVINSVPFATTFDNSSAPNEGGPRGTCNDDNAMGMDNDVWFSYAPPNGCFLSLEADSTTYDGMMAIYTGPDCTNPIEIDCLDDPDNPMSTSFPAIAGTTYWFQIGDWGTSAGGGFTTFDLDCTPCADADLDGVTDCDGDCDDDDPNNFPGNPETCDSLDNNCDGSTDEGGVCEMISVFVDIKPGACPNFFNRNGHGVLPVAVLGTTIFDVSQIDPATVTLSRADGTFESVAPNEGPPGPHSVLRDVATAYGPTPCECTDANGDNITDLLMYFRTDEIVAALQMNDDASGAMVELIVRGELNNGSLAEISGSDCVQLVPPGSPPGLLSVLQSGITEAYVEISPFDDQLDSGGFGDFERSFPQTTVSTLAAVENADGKRFLGWKVDGTFQSPDLSIGLTVEGSTQTVEAIYRRPGDIIADDLVNLVDFGQFVNCFGKAPNSGPACTAEFHAASDLNRDGRIDLTDFGTFAGHYAQ